jgi:hypothetical protein
VSVASSVTSRSSEASELADEGEVEGQFESLVDCEGGGGGGGGGGGREPGIGRSLVPKLTL